MNLRRLLTFRLCVLASLVLGPAALARAEPRWGFGAALGAGVPAGEFASRGPATGFAFDFIGLIGFPQLPLLAGAEVGWVLFWPYGDESGVQGFPELTADASSTPSALLAHLIGRVQWPRGDFRPFIDFRYGLKHFTADTEITVTNADGMELPVREFSGPSDTAPSYGFGIGFDLYLGAKAHLTVVAKFLWGGTVSYVLPSSGRLAGSEYLVSLADMESNMLLIEVGVTFGSDGS